MRNFTQLGNSTVALMKLRRTIFQDCFSLRGKPACLSIVSYRMPLRRHWKQRRVRASDTSSGQAHPRCGAQKENGSAACSASLNSQRFPQAIRAASAIRSRSNCFSQVCLSIESRFFSGTVAFASRNGTTRPRRDLAKSRSKPTSGPLGATIR